MTSIFPHSSEDDGCYQMCLSSHHLTFSPSAWSEEMCAFAAPWGRGLPGGQTQPVTAPLLLGLRECSVCSLLELCPPLWQTHAGDDWSNINNVFGCITRSPAVRGKKWLKPPTVRGYVHASPLIVFQCLQKWTHWCSLSKKWQSLDEYRLGIHVVVALLCTPWARKLPPTPVRDPRLSPARAPLCWDHFTLPIENSQHPPPPLFFLGGS